MSDLRMTLEKLGAMGCVAEKFIAEHGTDYEGRKLPPTFRSKRLGYCFMNAGRLATDNNRLTYVEGYGAHEMFGGLPMLHAWCIDEHGLVVDPTWPLASSSEYIGVPIKQHLLRREMLRTGHWGVLFVRGVKFNKVFVEQWKRETADAIRDQTNPRARKIGARR